MADTDTGVVLVTNPTTGTLQSFPVDDPDFDAQLDARASCCGGCAGVCDL